MIVSYVTVGKIFYIFMFTVYLKLNGTHQLLAYADDVNVLGGSAHTVKENAEALLVATKRLDWK